MDVLNGSGMHFQELVNNWHTEFDDVLCENVGPGKFYDNTSLDDNPEAFFDALAVGNFTDHRNGLPSQRVVPESFNDADQLQIDDSISECFGSTPKSSKNRRESRQKDHRPTPRRNSREIPIEVALGSSPPPDFRRAAKTIIKQCERIQEEYDLDNGTKRRPKSKNEQKSKSHDLHHGDVSMTSQKSKSRDHSCERLQMSSDRILETVPKVESGAKTQNKRKLTKIFRKKNGRKTSRAHRVKSPTTSGYSKGKGARNCGFEYRSGKMALGVIDNAHVIEVDIPDERKCSDSSQHIHTSLDLNNNQRLCRKDLSKQLGVPEWILKEVCANLNNKAPKTTPQKPVRPSPTEPIKMTSENSTSERETTGDDERSKKLTEENGHLVSLLVESKAVVDKMKDEWLKIDAKLNLALSRKAASEDESDDESDEDLQTLMNRHLECLLRVSAILDENDLDLDLIREHRCTSTPRKPQRSFSSLATTSTQTDRTGWPLPNRHPDARTFHKHDVVHAYAETGLLVGEDTEDMYETLKTEEIQPKLVGKVSPFARAGRKLPSPVKLIGLCPGVGLNQGIGVKTPEKDHGVETDKLKSAKVRKLGVPTLLLAPKMAEKTHADVTPYGIVGNPGEGYFISDTDAATFDDCSTCVTGVETADLGQDLTRKHGHVTYHDDAKSKQNSSGISDLMERVNTKWKEIEQKYGADLPPTKKRQVKNGKIGLLVENESVKNCRAINKPLPEPIIGSNSAFIKVDSRRGRRPQLPLPPCDDVSDSNKIASTSNVKERANKIASEVDKMAHKSNSEESTNNRTSRSNSMEAANKITSRLNSMESSNKRPSRSNSLECTNKMASHFNPIETINKRSSVNSSSETPKSDRKRSEDSVVLDSTARRRRRRQSRERMLRRSSNDRNSIDSDFADKSEVSSDEETGGTSSSAKRPTRKVSRRKHLSSSENGKIDGAAIVRKRLAGKNGDLDTSECSCDEGKVPRPPRRRHSDDTVSKNKQSRDEKGRRFSEMPSLTHSASLGVNLGSGMVRSKGNFCLDRIGGAEELGGKLDQSVENRGRFSGADFPDLLKSDKKYESEVPKVSTPRNSSVLRASYSQIKEIYTGKNSRRSLTGGKESGALEMMEASQGSGEMPKMEQNATKTVQDKGQMSSCAHSSGEENKHWYEQSDEEVLILDGCPRIINTDNSIYGVPSDGLVTFF